MATQIPFVCTTSHAAKLRELFGPPYMVMDGDTIVEWAWPGMAGFPGDEIPSEAQCAIWLGEADANRVRAVRGPLLTEVDVIVSRCYQAGIPFPADWRTYAQDLRDWPETPEAPQPEKPELPEGI